ncbi:MAG TPA: flagellar hook-associated protein FlgL [Steroidobacteraceae bacterium]|jgi:flagellar hook-associated protein 3 FlgL|nr:flagellar hook-associated protein FlgL [Steroidobacteraceae bacterium]
MRISTPMLNNLALNGIMQDESALSSTQNQLSTGLSINSPADNPAGEVELLQLTAASSQYQQYLSNGQGASSNLNLEEQALTSASTTLQSVQSLVTEANSGTNNSGDLQSIATQIQQLGQQLLGTANSTNATGQYLFAGYSVNTQPFVRGSSGAVNYVGDSGVSSVALDGGTSVQTGDAGSSVFMNVPTGNGTFTTTASSSNTGTGVIDAGSVTDASAWVPGQYTISFTDASDYQVTDGAGNVVDSGTYDASNGGSIQFDGIQVGISGAPAAGDSFAVGASGSSSVFDTLDSLVSSLQSAGSSSAARAQLTSKLDSALQQVNNAISQISTVNTSVGTRISLISSLNSSVTSQSTTVTTQITNLDGLNYAAATSQYSQEYLALQAAEESFSQLGQLSLFKYL